MLSNYLLAWMGEIFFLKGIHMKNLAKVMFGVAAVAAVTASAVPVPAEHEEPSRLHDPVRGYPGHQGPLQSVEAGLVPG